MDAPVLPPTLRLRDRVSLRLRMWRAGRAGIGEARAAQLDRASTTAASQWVAAVSEGALSPSGLGTMGQAELRLFDGAVLDLGMCHLPTVAGLRRALAAGPVVVERLADHGHCWGVYLRTTAGSFGVLASRLDVTGGGGGERRSERPLVLA